MAEEKSVYETYYFNLVKVCGWTEEDTNKFIIKNVNDESAKAEARKALEELNKEVVTENKEQTNISEEKNKQSEEPKEKPYVNLKVSKNYNKNKKFKLVRRISLLVMTAAVAALVTLAPGIVSQINDYHNNDVLNDEIASLVVNDNAYTVSNNNEENLNEIETQTYKDIDFNSLNQINNDTVGWIECEGTNINYPVVQGNDNDYYLHNSINHESNSAGTVFMDYQNDENMTDQVTVIYGHNMLNDSMFGSLSEYENQDYYNVHPKMYYHTEDAIYEIDLFAAVKADATKLKLGTYNDTNEFLQDMNNAKNNSYFESNIEITADSKVMVFFTCLDSGSNTNNRFLVYGTVNKVLDKTMNNNISMGIQK